MVPLFGSDRAIYVSLSTESVTVATSVFGRLVVCILTSVGSGRSGVGWTVDRSLRTRSVRYLSDQIGSGLLWC